MKKLLWIFIPVLFLAGVVAGTLLNGQGWLSVESRMSAPLTGDGSPDAGVAEEAAHEDGGHEDEHGSEKIVRMGSKEMKEIFSEIHYRELWRRVWAALAEGQAELGVVSKEELEDILSKAKREFIDLERAHEVEKKIRHDVMAELKVFTEQCPVGGGVCGVLERIGS